MASSKENGTEAALKDEKQRLSKENLREALKIFAFLRPYRWKFFGAMICIACSSITVLSFPYMLKLLLDSSTTGEHRFGLETEQIVLIMFGILMLQLVFSYLRVYLFSMVGENSLADIRKAVYTRLIQMPMNFFSQRRVGELSSRLSADLSQIQDTLTINVADLLRVVLTLAIGIGLIFYISSRLTLVMLLVLPVIILVAVLFGKRIRKLSRQSQDQLADSNTIVQETLQGIGNVKAFSNEWFEIRRYAASLSGVVNMAVKSGRARGLFIAFLLFSLFSTCILVVWYGIQLMKNGQLGFGDLTAFVLYTSFIGGSMAGFADLYGQLQKTIGSTQRVRELLTAEIEPVEINETAVEPAYRLQGNVRLSLIHI